MRRIQGRVRSLKAKAQNRRGTAMVEFALTAPVFLALILGVAEMGKALDVQNILSAGVREGGRLGTMDWTSTVPQGSTINQKIADDIKNFYTAAGVSGKDVTVTIKSAEGSDMGQTFDLSKAANAGRLFTITATMPYSKASSYPATYMKNKSVTASLTFRAGRTTLVQ